MANETALPHRTAHPGSLGNQLLVVYGFSLAIGLQIGLIRFLLWGRPRSIWSSLAGGIVMGTMIIVLWRWVFPKLPGTSEPRRTAWESLVSLVAIGVSSCVFIELLTAMFYDYSILNPYAGGDVELIVSARRLRYSPLAWALLPVVPTAVMAVIGYRRYWAPILELENRTEELSELAASAQLAALRAQIHPHFFFNSLNSIAQLVRTDPDEAEACIERLADIFRYLTRQVERDFVPLADELEIVDAYLDIQRARFGDNLKVEKRSDTRALRHSIPSLILQPVIENAVCHGISQKMGAGTVTIETALGNGYLTLRVTDDGVGMGPNRLAQVYDHGFALRNIRDRLDRLYGPAARLHIRSVPERGTSVLMRLPVGAQGAGGSRLDGAGGSRLDAAGGSRLDAAGASRT